MIREISKLPFEEQAAALALVRRRLPQVPKPRAGLWCGHPESSAVVDRNGVTVCVECSR